MATSSHTVTVVDTTVPVFTSVPADIALNNCGPASLGLPTATDDCGGSPAFANNAPAKFALGPTVVTWTATDLSGNQASAPQTVTVTDTVAPRISCEVARYPDDDDDGDDDDHDGDDDDGDDDDDGHGHRSSGVANRAGGHGDHDDDDDGGSSYFKVTSRDSCAPPPPTIRLGTFTLVNDEIIKITRSHKPGIRFLGLVGHAKVKHFKGGPGGERRPVHRLVRKRRQRGLRAPARRRRLSPGDDLSP